LKVILTKSRQDINYDDQNIDIIINIQKHLGLIKKEKRPAGAGRCVSCRWRL